MKFCQEVLELCHAYGRTNRQSDWEQLIALRSDVKSKFVLIFGKALADRWNNFYAGEQFLNFSQHLQMKTLTVLWNKPHIRNSGRDLPVYCPYNLKITSIWLSCIMGLLFQILLIAWLKIFHGVSEASSLWFFRKKEAYLHLSFGPLW
jgi:hypothetical protein